MDEFNNIPMDCVPLMIEDPMVAHSGPQPSFASVPAGAFSDMFMLPLSLASGSVGGGGPQGGKHSWLRVY
jgi:hypothetical protein